jgi:3-oxoacyl-[acyl-carrier-protein] synthase II
VEAIATVLALRERLIPPTLGFEDREEGLDLDYVPGSARVMGSNGSASAAPSGSAPEATDASNGSAPTRAVGMSNSFGFGGHNAVLVLSA